MISKLIHDLTQKGIEVRFNSDFEGMITVSYYEEHGGFLTHEHLGYPEAPEKILEENLKKSLEKKLSDYKK